MQKLNSCRWRLRCIDTQAARAPRGRNRCLRSAAKNLTIYYAYHCLYTRYRYDTPKQQLLS